MAHRKHFTDLAELAGHIASGRIPLTEVIEEFAATLAESTELGFKRDKFVAHANKQREIEAYTAREIHPGMAVTVDGMQFRCDETSTLASGQVRLLTTIDSADPTNSIVSFTLDPETIV